MLNVKHSAVAGYCQKKKSKVKTFTLFVFSCTQSYDLLTSSDNTSMYCLGSPVYGPIRQVSQALIKPFVMAVKVHFVVDLLLQSL